jgi:hypothetical protein
MHTTRENVCQFAGPRPVLPQPCSNSLVEGLLVGAEDETDRLVAESAGEVEGVSTLPYCCADRANPERSGAALL